MICVVGSLRRILRLRSLRLLAGARDAAGALDRRGVGGRHPWRLARHRAVGLGLTAALALGGGGCGVLGGGGGGYQLTAYFDVAVGLYPHGDVLVMGQPAGTVDDVVLEDTRVRVEMTIDDDVPLPDDVGATIEALTLIGERHVSLFPPWNAEMAAAGRGRAADGDTIPLERTVVPVEPDEGLEAFNDLARSLDPEVVGSFVSDAARALDGQGADVGRALDAASTLTGTMASIDSQLLDAAASLHVVADSLESRDAQLRQLIESFGAATDVLADQRQGIATLLAGLVALTEEGRALLDAHADHLPADIADLAALAGVLDRNASSVEQLLTEFPNLAEGLNRAYRPDIDGFHLRASGGASFDGAVDQLTGLLDELGILPGAPG